jgi:hypothetical protein
MKEVTLMYYYHHPLPYHQPINYHPYPALRQYPQVDANLLYQSANETKKLMHDASLVLEKLSVSKEFDAELMYAAQMSDVQKVKRLIHSIGVSSKVDIHFNPDGLRLEFNSGVQPLDCCRLMISLRWR